MILHTGDNYYGEVREKLTTGELYFIIELLSVTDRFNEFALNKQISKRKNETVSVRLQNNLNITERSIGNTLSTIKKKLPSLILKVDKPKTYRINPEFGSTCSSIREAYMAVATYGTTKEEYFEIQKVYNECKNLNKNEVLYNVDHIVPISQNGKHLASNLQILTVKEHQEKSAKERK